MDAAAAQKIDYAVSENTEILLDLGPVDGIGYKISEHVDNIVLTSNHAQESLPKTIYACHVCDKIFDDNDKMLDHLSERHATKWVQTQNNKSPIPPPPPPPILSHSTTEHDYYRKPNYPIVTGTPSYDPDQDMICKPYKCAHCGERFKRGSEVGAHMLKHSHTLQHNCDFCGLGFDHQSKLDEHCSLFHSAHKENLVSQHRCGHCGTSFSHRNSLYKHIKSHRDTLAASYEKKVTKDPGGPDMLTHAQSPGKRTIKQTKTNRTYELRKLKKYSCNLCYSKFQTKDSLTKHISSHPEWNPSVCEVCGEYFAMKTDLKKHQKIHKEKLFCKICSRGFVSHKRLEKHTIMHSTSQNSLGRIESIKVQPRKTLNKKLRPELTNASNKGKVQGKDKNLTQNSKKTQKLISKGKSTVKTNAPAPGRLKTGHLSGRKNRATNDSSYNCDICTKSFPLLKQLTAHLNKWHCMIQDKFDCEYCNRSFTRRMTYLNHLLKHYRKSNYSCQNCSLDFKNSFQLRQHRQSSCRPRKPYICDYCLEGFNTQLDRKRHVESAHLSAATEFKCNICSRQMQSKKQLSRHMHLHEVKTQYQCDLCAQTFNKLSFLLQHLVKHAQKVIYRCRFCSTLFPTQLLLHKHLLTHKNS